MLSQEKRPVDTITTDANGLPRWVMCHWDYADRAPEFGKVLLLATPEGMQHPRLPALIFVPDQNKARIVSLHMLHECPPD